MRFSRVKKCCWFFRFALTARSEDEDGDDDRRLRQIQFEITFFAYLIFVDACALSSPIKTMHTKELDLYSLIPLYRRVFRSIRFHCFLLVRLGHFSLSACSPSFLCRYLLASVVAHSLFSFFISRVFLCLLSFNHIIYRYQILEIFSFSCFFSFVFFFLRRRLRLLPPTLACLLLRFVCWFCAWPTSCN